MTLKLNDTGDVVAKWRHVMAAMFPAYAKTLGPLDPGSVFGARAQAWQQEYERRTGQTVDGIVSDQDLADLHIVYPHRPIWIYSAPGSGAPWWIGPAFDTGEWAKQVLHLNHQPVGYPIGGYMGLMGGDPANSYIDIIHDLDLELERLLGVNPDINNPAVELWFTAYSQSADGMKKSVNRLFGPGGKYESLRGRINGLLLFGDPARQPGPTKVGNNPVGSGIARWVAPAWLEALTWSITVETPAPDFYAACDDDIRPLFYEWFVQAKTSLGFMVYCGQIIIPALLNLVAPFLGGLAGLGNPLATTILATQSGLPINLMGQLIGGVLGSTEKPDPKLIEFLSIQGILTNLPALLKLLSDLPGIGAHGDYYTPRAELGNRNGIQVACDVMASFRR